MPFDLPTLLLSLIFGMIGMGMFMYGKNAGRMVPLGAGAALMVFPYFIPNIIAQVIVCLILTFTPLIVREG
ncbi:MAG TPA: hypothetical protein VL992_05550 [Tepidisphaeraceae bacterium]|nr:hypothetical protein [Tepidisphaeraceae bacterium]